MPEFNPTPAQYLAIHDRGGELLVSAAAGSGKTRVLVERLMSYILDGENPADITDFLVITFTRAAAEQLRGRIGEELTKLERTSAEPGRIRRQMALLRRAQICTIDSFCVSLLRENAALTGLDPDFALCDEQRASELKAAALETVLEEAYERSEPDFIALADSVGAGRDDSRLQELILELHEKLQSHSRPEQWAAEQRRDLSELPTDAADTVWGRELVDEAIGKLRYWLYAIKQLRDDISEDEDAERAYSASLEATADSLSAAIEAAAEGWDALRAALPIDFPRVGRFSGDAELKEYFNLRRDACKKAMTKLAKDFSALSCELLRDLRATSGAMNALLDVTEAFNAEYIRRKRRRSLIDFADAEHLASRLLTNDDGSPSEFALELSGRYAEVMIDEYQDVSRVQEEIVRAVSGAGRRLFMVGDVKQSIYRFRLADPSIFIGKYERFYDAPQPEGVPRRVFLRESFRSRPEIVSAVNSVFGCLMSYGLGELDYDEHARLVAGLPYTGFVPEPELVLIEKQRLDERGEELPDDPGLEARYAAGRMRELVESGTMLTSPGAERPVGYGDMAVLLRSANVTGPIWRRELERMGIPVEAGQAGGFFTAPEIEVMLSLLSILDNPRQDVQLISVLRSALFGFTPDELSAVRLASEKGCLWEALNVRAAEDEKCRRFTETVRELRELSGEAELTELIGELYSRLDCYAVCAALTDGDARAARLSRLFELAREFERGAWRGLRRFNEWIAEMRESGHEPPMPAAQSSGAVRIMSIHQSKGLEFAVVFLGDTAHRFNDMDMRSVVLVHPELGLGSKVRDAERGVEYPTLSRRAVASRLRREQLSEELRLLYVAMTRARERLIMTCCMRDPFGRFETLAALAERNMAAEPLLAMRQPSDWLMTAVAADDGRTLRLVRAEEGTQRASMSVNAPAERESAPAPAAAEELECRFAWSYPRPLAVRLPSKVTATELKSLPEADEEGAQLIAHASRPFRVPDISGIERRPTAAERGTATHLALRYIDLSSIGSVEAAADAVEALAAEGRISASEARAADAVGIYTLASGALGRRMSAAERIWRELPFTLLRPAGELFPGGGDDEILLQGVVDCCFIEDGSVIVVDYKTDRVSAEGAAGRAERYRTQLECYAWAMERVIGLPVKEKIVYFLRCGAEIAL